MVQFDVPVDHKEKNKRKRIALQIVGPFARKLKRLWNMTVTVITIVVGVLCIVPKDLYWGNGRRKSKKESRPFRLQHCWDRVIYWPSTEPSIKRCTCVNKRKNSRIWRTLENNITRCLEGDRVIWRQDAKVRTRQTEGCGPLVIPGWATQAKMRKKCC